MDNFFVSPSQVDYQALVQQGKTFRTYLDHVIATYPQLFLCSHFGVQIQCQSDRDPSLESG